MHGLGQVANVRGGDARHGDPTILGEVDAVLLSDLFHLSRSHPGEAEHPNLIGNVLPVFARACTDTSTDTDTDTDTGT